MKTILNGQEGYQVKDSEVISGKKEMGTGSYRL
jgi:hypothetical protein